MATLTMAKKLAVYKRQANKCALCQQETRLCIHHIIFRECGGTNRHDNLLAMCQSCHIELHKVCDNMPHRRVHELQEKLINLNRKKYLHLQSMNWNLADIICNFYKSHAIS